MFICLFAATLFVGSWGCLEEENNVQHDLRIWTAKHNIAQAALKDVVVIFNKYFNAGVQSDPRSIMKTPRRVVITPHNKPDDDGLEDGSAVNDDELRVRKKVHHSQYWHQGLKTCLRMCFPKLNADLAISLNFNIDGLPLHKSTNKSFWPILFNVHEYPALRPMAIGIFYGDTKPENMSEYLRPFVLELKDILRDGVSINGKKLIVRVRCFICDSPARAFIKGTMNFNAKHGCQKCTTIGKYSYTSNTTIFPSIHDAPRTDALFRQRKYPQHQTLETPLISLPIDMIQDFVVADPLHLLELGVKKRMILGWTATDARVSFGYKTKLSMREKIEISNLLLKIEVPSEVHRDARSLKLLPHWKGLEFRNFLNYFGIAVLQPYLPTKYFDHFLLLFCAVRLCSSNIYSVHFKVAKLLFDDFINDFKKLYGVEYITSNLHNLSHVVGDVQRFGELNSISAYPFESALYSIKRMLRAGKLPLVQIANRLSDRKFNVDFNYEDTTKKKPVAIKHRRGGGISIQLSTFLLSTNFKDMWFFANNQIYKMKNAFQNNNEYFIEAVELQNFDLYFDKPFRSSFLDIYAAKNPDNFRASSKIIDIRNIKCKFVVIKIANGLEYLFIPLIHTLREV